MARPTFSVCAARCLFIHLFLHFTCLPRFRKLIGIGLDLTTLPSNLFQRFGDQQLETIDFSHNLLTDLAPLEGFVHVTSLNLDNNFITERTLLPVSTIDFLFVSDVIPCFVGDASSAHSHSQQEPDCRNLPIPREHWNQLPRPQVSVTAGQYCLPQRARREG